MIALFRKSLTSSRLWTERLSLLGDPPIARAFAEMTARPGAAHDVETLARVAGLSRSAFMDRFKRLFGESPMAALRDLRLRHAATQIGTGHLSVDQAAHDAGYSDRSSFARAFRKLHGCQPSEYKERLSAMRIDPTPTDHAKHPAFQAPCRPDEEHSGSGRSLRSPG